MASKNIVYFDLETQKWSEEFGGWDEVNKHNLVPEMKLSVGVTYSSAEEDYKYWDESSVDKLLIELAFADLVVGFNLIGFDYSVLSAYTDKDLSKLKTFDMLDHIKRRLTFRVSLDNLAAATLNEEKMGDGVQAVEWWKAGEIEKIKEYCAKDVELTRRLFIHACKDKYLLQTNKRVNEIERINTDYWHDEVRSILELAPEQKEKAA